MRDTRNAGWLVLLALLWSSTFGLVKLALEVPPLTMTSIRLPRVTCSAMAEPPPGRAVNPTWSARSSGIHAGSRCATNPSPATSTVSGR